MDVLRRRKPGPSRPPAALVLACLVLGPLTLAAAAPGRLVPDGRYLDYSFERSRAPQAYRGGPLRLTVSPADKGELGLASRVRIEAPGMKPFVIEGDPEQPGVDRHLAVLKLNRESRLPAVLVTSFSGGAHCCTHLQLAVPGPSGFRAVDLGDEWDGDIAYPADLSHDGVPDFVVPDSAFLYTFTAYAFSAAPPRILNIVGGKMVDVSDRPGFRAFWAGEMRAAEPLCRDRDPARSAGGCPAFVAAAARAGQLDPAWRTMVAVHKPDPKWELPERCKLDPRPGCSGRYGSYAEALEALLKAGGYAPRSWQPPAKS